MASNPKLQQYTSDILAECLRITEKRAKQYGVPDNDGNIFSFTADIATRIGQTGFTADDIHVVFIAMKLARYENQLQMPEEHQSEDVINDSLIDCIVYMALREAGRRVRNEQKRQTSSTTEDVRPRDGQPIEEFIRRSRSAVREGLQEESAGSGD